MKYASPYDGLMRDGSAHFARGALELTTLPVDDPEGVMSFGKLRVERQGKTNLSFCRLEIVLLLERDTEIVVSDRGVRVPAKDFTEVGGSKVEFGLL